MGKPAWEAARGKARLGGRMWESLRLSTSPVPAFAVFQVPIAQNNQYAKVYVEVTYSATAHSPLQTL